MPLTSLAEQIGGEPAIRRILEDLYTRLFDDLMVGFLFAGHDKAHIVEMQTVFTRRMLGDLSADYRGKSVPEAHAALPILPGHFDRRHRVLAEVLAAHAVPDEVQRVWLRLDQGLRTAVVRVGQARINELNEPSDEEGSEC